MGPRFAETFKDRPQDGRAAFAALAVLHVNQFDLWRLASAVGKAGQNELAFQIVSQLRWGKIGEMVFLTDAYRYLKAWRGEEIALDWLRRAVPPGMLNRFSQAIFWAGEYELLWSLIEDPEKGSDPEKVWLMRAAAPARQGWPKDRNREALFAYYGNSGGMYSHAIGRFLLGLGTEGEVLVLAADPRKRCEVAFYVGLRAQGEGRYVDASDWFRVAIETGQDRTGEYAWSYNTLANWEGAGKSLARIAAERS